MGGIVGTPGLRPRCAVQETHHLLTPVDGLPKLVSFPKRASSFDPRLRQKVSDVGKLARTVGHKSDLVPLLVSLPSFLLLALRILRADVAVTKEELGQLRWHPVLPLPFHAVCVRANAPLTVRRASDDTVEQPC